MTALTYVYEDIIKEQNAKTKIEKETVGIIIRRETDVISHERHETRRSSYLQLQFSLLTSNCYIKPPVLQTQTLLINKQSFSICLKVSKGANAQYKI